MHDQQRKELEELIRQEIAKTEETVRSYRENTQPISPENAIGRVSRMDAINNKSVAEAALRQAENKLKKLEIALSKIDDPQFGKCARCGKAIPPKRLALMPQSPYCVNCAQ